MADDDVVTTILGWPVRTLRGYSTPYFYVDAPFRAAGPANHRMTIRQLEGMARRAHAKGKLPVKEG